MSDICSICHNDIDSNKNFVITNCGHKFHFMCLYENIKKNNLSGNKCPLCRKYLSGRSKKQSPEPPINSIYNFQTNLNIFNNIRWQSRAFIRRRGNIQNRRINPVRFISRVRNRRTLRPRESIIREGLKNLSFEELKEKMRRHNISTRGYIRENLERRLLSHLLRNNI